VAPVDPVEVLVLLLEAELDEDLLLLEAELEEEVLVALLEAELVDEVLVALLVDEVLVLEEVEVVVVGVRTFTAGMVASSPMAHKSCPISIQI